MLNIREQVNKFGFAEIPSDELAGIRKEFNTGEVGIYSLLSISKQTKRTWLFLKNSSSAKPFTIQFRLPKDFLFKKTKDNKILVVRDFFSKWVSGYIIEDMEELKSLHLKFVYDFCVISCPEFLKSELISDIDILGSQSWLHFLTQEKEDHSNKLLKTKEDVKETCISCGNVFKVSSLAQIIECPKCKGKYTKG